MLAEIMNNFADMLMQTRHIQKVEIPLKSN